jgi:hypothetical protein
LISFATFVESSIDIPQEEGPGAEPLPQVSFGRRTQFLAYCSENIFGRRENVFLSFHGRVPEIVAPHEVHVREAEDQFGSVPSSYNATHRYFRGGLHRLSRAIHQQYGIDVLHPSRNAD